MTSDSLIDLHAKETDDAAMKRNGLRQRVAAVGVLVLLTALAGCASGGGSHGGAPFAGLVPWDSAVVESDGRTVHLLADWDHIDHGVCALPNEKLFSTETASKVVITVRGYAKPLPAGVSCGGVGSPLQPFTLVLKTQLGKRQLIDGTSQRTRRVLRDADVPTAHAVPLGYVGSPMSWSFESGNEHTATRVWTKGGANSTAFIRLTVGLPTKYYTFAGPAGVSRGTTTVGRSIAHIYGVDRGGQVVTTIRWTTASGQERSLGVFGTDRSHLSVAEVESVADSVR